MPCFSRICAERAGWESGNMTSKTWHHQIHVVFLLGSENRHIYKLIANLGWFHISLLVRVEIRWGVVRLWLAKKESKFNRERSRPNMYKSVTMSSVVDMKSDQIIIFHEHGFPWNKRFPLLTHHLGEIGRVTSRPNLTRWNAHFEALVICGSKNPHHLILSYSEN